MALASATCENAALAGMAGQNPSNQMPWMSLHTATPSTTGASENAATGSYTRQAVSWGTPASGSMANTNAQTFSTAGSVAVTHIGTNSASGTSGGTYAIGAALNSSVTAASITIAIGGAVFSAS